VIYGQQYVDDYDTSPAVSRLVAAVSGAIHAVYRQEVQDGRTLPAADHVMPKVRGAIESALKRGQAGS
jgi:hypothetical protein